MQDIDELEDFDIPAVRYELWATGYTDENAPAGFEVLLKEFSDPDDTVAAAEQINLADIISHGDTLGCTYFNIEVATVVAVEAEGLLDSGIIYRRAIANTTPVADLQLEYLDYELDFSGNLIIRGDKVSKFKVGDYFNVIVSACVSRPALLKVKEKTADFILCEFID